MATASDHDLKVQVEELRLISLLCESAKRVYAGVWDNASLEAFYKAIRPYEKASIESGVAMLKSRYPDVYKEETSKHDEARKTVLRGLAARCPGGLDHLRLLLDELKTCESEPAASFG